MKIAVVGIGVAGAYLMNRLSDDHDNQVVGFERMPEGQHDAVCAWATCENVMAGLAKNCGLDFDDYVLHDGRNMEVDLGDKGSIDIGLRGMVSYDKLRLIQDKRLEDAVAEWRRVLDLEPRHPNARRNTEQAERPLEAIERRRTH